MRAKKNKSPKSNTYYTRQLPLTIALLLASFLLTVQYRANQQLDVSLSTQTNSNLIAMVRSLSEKRVGLEKELDDLNTQLASFGLVGSVEKQVEQMHILTGEVAVTGPGITVVITGDSPLVYLDLVDIINELKVSGAAAIAVNDQRIFNTSKFAQGTATGSEFVITVDGKTIEAPIVIKAIGDPVNLETGLTFPGGIVDNMKHNNITPLLVQVENLIIPAAGSQKTPEYMQKLQEEVETD